MKDHDDKKPKIEENRSGNIRNKQTGKQYKESSHSEEAPKENYIHVRARRGQATNSHSLAERVLTHSNVSDLKKHFSFYKHLKSNGVLGSQVRREKISERMRLLQELVPGCNKVIRDGQSTKVVPFIDIEY